MKKYWQIVLLPLLSFAGGCGSSAPGSGRGADSGFVLSYPVTLNLFEEGSASYDKEKRTVRIDYHDSVEVRRIPCSEVFDSIRYVPLETRDDLLLGGRIFDLVYTGKEFILSDRDQVYRFSPEGKFLNRIGRIGRGPKEYIYTFRTAVCGSGDSGSVLLNSGQGKMHRFRLDGTYVNSFPYNRHGYEYGWNDSTQVVGTRHPRIGTDNPDCVEVQDMQGDTVWKRPAFLSFPQPRSNGILGGFEGGVSSYRDTANVRISYVDTVYRVHPRGGMTPRFVVGLGKYKIPDDMVPESGNVPFEELVKEAFRFFGFDFQETDLFALVQVYTAVESYTPHMYFLFDKRTGRLSATDLTELRIGDRTVRIPGFYNDVDGSLPFCPKYLGERYMLDVLQPRQLVWMKEHPETLSETYSDPQARAQLQELLEHYDENDNPVLVVGRVRSR